MKKLYAVIFILLAFVTVSCGGKDKVKQSADSLLAVEALSTIDAIKDAYQIKDTGTLQRRIDAKLAEGILKAFDFEKSELSFTTRMIRITDESVKVDLSWQGTWWTAKDRKLENRGLAALVLQRDTLKLIQINGDNPFLTPIEK